MQVADGCGVALIDEHAEEKEIYFEPTPGGVIEFKLKDDGRLLGRVTVGDDITAEVNVADDLKEKAHAYVADAVKNADKHRVKALTKRLKGVKRSAPEGHRWRHTTGTTGADLARVMVALRDAIDRWCFVTPKDKKKQWRFLCDSCCDTHLIAWSFVVAMGLEHKIDKSVKRNIGTANSGAAFQTVGTLEHGLEIRDVLGTWHTLVLMWHVADIGDKCLINTTALRKGGWRFCQQNNADGSDGTCLIAPDGVVFALGGDDHEMPIMPTGGAPVVHKSKPSTLRRLAENITHLAKYGNKPAPPQPKHRGRRAALTYGSDSEESDATSHDEDSDDYDYDSEWETEEEEDAACMAAIAGRALKTHRPRAKTVVHTPASWHNLMHAGKVLSEASAKTSTARFEVNGKVKFGHELNSSDLAALEGARLACHVCKQTKTTAAAAKRAGRAQVSFGPTTYRPE